MQRGVVLLYIIDDVTISMSNCSDEGDQLELEPEHLNGGKEEMQNNRLFPDVGEFPGRRAGTRCLTDLSCCFCILIVKHSLCFYYFAPLKPSC